MPAAPRKVSVARHSGTDSPTGATVGAEAETRPRREESRRPPRPRPSTPASHERRDVEPATPRRAASSRLIRVPGCFGTKSVQQSASGSIEISKVPSARACSVISSLSMPISGRRTGSSAASSIRAEIRERLGGDLAQAVAGHERGGARAMREAFGDAHHETAVDDHAGLSRHRQHDLALDLTERHQEEPGEILPLRQRSDQAARFPRRHVRQVRHAVEVDEDHPAPPLHQPPCGHG